ncbi:MAG: type ISP restriction/modification enzyme [Candidatus Brocadiia bacterium]
MRDIHDTGAATDETSYYPALSNLLDEIGKTLKPKVRCVQTPADSGAGLPDFGLFTADQIRKNDPNPMARSTAPGMQGQLPARGVVEVKGPAEDVTKVAESEQVKRYSAKYGVVLVTNYRDFLLLGRDAQSNPLPAERFTLAESASAFWKLAAQPRKAAEEKDAQKEAAQGARFCEYLKRVMLSVAPLSAPQDLAWFLASYARDARARVENHKDLSALDAVRGALEEALGMKFTGEKGAHFFRSTLVQTIFYGVFSAWVLWHRERPEREDAFNWHESAFSLRVPFIRALYEQIATPRKLGDLELVEVLDWTTGALNRVDRAVFFQKFQGEHAVQYFYEPFLEAFDPELRKELGVWFTPPEIVQYQVARVDTVLREELGLADGLADPNVVVLDPCCGTAAYLVEVLKKIAETLKAKGGDALIASDLKKAAMTRVFGFEILPAPFVVSHLQLGLLLHRLGVPLSAKSNERVGVYLTNALTGWEPPKEPKQTVLGFMEELQQEKDAAEHVKRDRKILVVLGNPPYNGFAGVALDEEARLIEPYKAGLKEWGITKNYLDDLYVRFFRLAERRIAEMSGKGVVSFISNQSWTGEPSFVVLRKHLLDSFDRFWIENLHGDRRISEYASDGRTSETVFAIRGFSSGIQQGVATSLWVKTGKPRKAGGQAQVLFRNDVEAAKAEERRHQLLATLDAKRFDAAYTQAEPRNENAYSFRPIETATGYLAWPAVVELAEAEPLLGLNDNRKQGTHAIEKETIADRMKAYYAANVALEDVARLHAGLTTDAAGFCAADVRKRLLTASGFRDSNIARFLFKPFDLRWAYIERIANLWNRVRPELLAQAWHGNRFLLIRCHAAKAPDGATFHLVGHIADQHVLHTDAYFVPIRLQKEAGRAKGLFHDASGPSEPTANLSSAARAYLAGLGINDPDAGADAAGTIWLHALAVGYSPAYLAENADGIRRDWPRIPLPDSRKTLEASAALGRQLAALLDTEAEVTGVTSGKLEPIFRTVGLLTKVGGGNLDPDAADLAVTAGWGHAGKEGVTMPAKGRIVQRPYDKAELEALRNAAEARGLSLSKAIALLGADTTDVYLNDVAYWKNIPAKVWEYYIGGYQVIKKWLSYREQELLGRALKAEEAREVTAMARRLARIVLLQPTLDANYTIAKSHAYAWPGVAEAGAKA